MPANHLINVIRGALLAAAMGGLGIAAVPAEAASAAVAIHPVVELHVYHDAPLVYRRHHHPRAYLVHPYFVPPYYARPYLPRALCMTSNELRRSVARRGYNGVSIFNISGNLAQLTAHRGRGEYVITLNRCTDTIVDIRRRF